MSTSELRHPASNKKGGQILVLMAMMSTTLIILFGMVVGIGHLVQAKMNLQNAVDMAAMSGASWQARYLNHLALINYRMRQNYKFTLYDMYVTQSRFNRALRRQLQTGGGLFDRITQTQTAFGICQQARGYCGRAPGEPQECTSDTTDMCQNVDTTLRTIPPIVASPVINLNPILIATNELVRALGATAVRYCQAAAGQNEAYFNYIMQRLDAQNQFQMRQNINVLEEFATAFGDGDNAEISSSSGKVADTTMAQTFLGNLISANAAGNPKLEYLNDSRSRAFRSNNFSQLETTIFNQTPPAELSDYFDRQIVRFAIRIINFRVVGGTGCSPEVFDRQYGGSTGAGTFLGLSRKRVDDFRPDAPVKIPFHVALRATVKPNLLFWPRNATPTLVAVAAAKPFGSRIGPSSSQTTFEVTGERSQRNFALANMSFYPGDDAFHAQQAGTDLPGVGHKQVLKYLLNSLVDVNSGRNDKRPSTVQPSGIDCTQRLDFLCLALAPTLYEGFFWNAFTFPNSATAAYFPQIKSALENFFPRELTERGVVQTAEAGRYYMPDRMNTGGNPESWHATPLIGRNLLTNSGKPAFFASPASSLSSWSPALNPDSDFTEGEIMQKGRLGFQIKLVALKEVCNEIQAGGNAVPLGQLARYCNQEEVFH